MSKSIHLSPRDETSTAVRLAVQRAFERFGRRGEGARAGSVEGVHGMRKATRELRSILRMFRPVADRCWVEDLRDELKRLAEVLGGLRDVHVQRQRLMASSAERDGDLGPLWECFDREQEARQLQLRTELESDRHQSLLVRLVEASFAPHLNGEAHLPCKDVIPRLAAKIWRKLRSEGRGLTPESPDEAYHEVRKRAKRTRHAIEAARASLNDADSKRAGRFHRRLLDLLDLLGEHQDAVVAQSWIERAGALHGDDPVYQRALGGLRERQEQAAETARGGFGRAWDRLDRKPLWRWMVS